MKKFIWKIIRKFKKADFQNFKLSEKDITDIKELLKSYPKILPADKSLDLLLKHPEKSLIRMGDCEIALMNGEDSFSNDYDPKLAYRLCQIVKDVNNKKFYLGLKILSFETKNFFISKNFLINGRNKNLKPLFEKRKNDTILNAWVNSVHMHGTNKIPLIKKLWEKKDIVFITGKNSSFKYIDFFFDNAKSINFEYGLNFNAFDDMDNLFNKCCKYPKETLFIVALGPTGSVISYDLINKGYKVLDLGGFTTRYLTQEYGFISAENHLENVRIKRGRNAKI